MTRADGTVSSDTAQSQFLGTFLILLVSKDDVVRLIANEYLSTCTSGSFCFASPLGGAYTDLYYRVDSLDNCPANGVIFPPGPRPSGTLSSGSTTRRRAATRCHSIDHEYCLIGSGTWACVDTQRSLTNCGGCVWNDVGAGGRDCSEEMMAGTNGTSYSGMPGLIGRDADLQVQCIRGECVFSRA